jgi:hypothetical protein
MPSSGAWNEHQTAPIRPPDRLGSSIGEGIRHHGGRKNRGVNARLDLRQKHAIPQAKNRVTEDPRSGTWSLEGHAKAISSDDVHYLSY